MKKIRVFAGTTMDNLNRYYNPATGIYQNGSDLLVDEDVRPFDLCIVKSIAWKKAYQTEGTPCLVSGEIDSSELNSTTGGSYSAKKMPVDRVYLLKQVELAATQHLHDCEDISDILNQLKNKK